MLKNTTTNGAPCLCKKSKLLQIELVNDRTLSEAKESEAKTPYLGVVIQPDTSTSTVVVADQD